MTCYIDLKVISSFYHSGYNLFFLAGGGYNLYVASYGFERQRGRSRDWIFILTIQTGTCYYVSICFRVSLSF
jgi:hypothetical protein